MDYLTEKIYNTFLRISRSRQGKPFKYRKNFTDFETDKNYLPVVRLKGFFTRNSQIKIEDFFLAPYIVFEKETDAFYDLNFYNSLQAIKVYSIYNRKIMQEDVDHEFQLKKIQEGIIFIKNFCLNKNITLANYLNYKTDKINDFLIHLRDKQILIYNVLPLKNFDTIIRTYDFELLSFILGDLASRISFYRTKFLSSSKAKHLSSEGLKKIDKIIQNKLEKP
jgi:hypothetical protein